MGLKKYKPTSPGLRTALSLDFEEIKKDLPSKKVKKLKRQSRRLRVAKHRKVGRNNQGRITTRFRSSGHKKLYRLVDFYRKDKNNIPAKVNSIDYDPFRNCWIALLFYADGEKRYVLAPSGIKSGDTLVSGPESKAHNGNHLPLYSIPLGTLIHNIELNPQGGGKLVRAAGQSAQLVSKEKGRVAIRLPSGEMRWFLENCYATVGTLSNSNFSNQVKGKAGKNRWAGRRPHVRGAAMNPVDHPHGGGEGKAPVGRSGPFTAFSKKQGIKTRKKKKSDQFIISGRKNKRR